MASTHDRRASHPVLNESADVAERFELEQDAGSDSATCNGRDKRTGQPVRVRRAPNVTSDNGIGLLHELAFCSRTDHAAVPKVLHVAAGTSGVSAVFSSPSGDTLETLFAKSGARSSELDVVRYGLEIANIAAAAHAGRFLLLEIGPANFVLDPRTKRLALAQATVCLPLESAAARERLRDRYVGGVWGYMAPEQVTDVAELGPHTDVFEVGATLFRLLTGRPLYETESTKDAISQTRSAKVPDIAKVRRGINPKLAKLLNRCLAKPPKERPATAQELALAIRALLNEMGPKLAGGPEIYKLITLPSGFAPDAPLSERLHGSVDETLAFVATAMAGREPSATSASDGSGRLKTERKERERLDGIQREADARSKAERERMERERAETERKERERLDEIQREADARGKAERERVERERAETERKERERLDEIQREADARSKAERERMERERAETGRKERERLDQIKREEEVRANADRAKAEGERAGAERNERERRERLGREEEARLAAGHERQEKERKAKEELEKAARENMKPSPHLALPVGGGVMATQPAAHAAAQRAEAQEPKAVPASEVTSRLQSVSADRYQVRRDIVLGGQGACKVAYDQLAEREVVLKAGSAQAGWSGERIVKEARYAAKFNHPNVSRLLELGTFGKDQVFMTMPYVDGSSLDLVLKRISEAGIPGLTGYSMVAVAELFEKICAGVEHAHGAGILHLDLKPQNVIVGSRGEVVVVDWGLAQLISGAEYPKRYSSGEQNGPPNLTSTLNGTLASDPNVRAIGTPAYMAPEQWAGDPGTFTERTDVYGLGAVLFFLLSGLAPNQVQRPTDLEPYFRHSPTPLPSDYTRRRVPPELESLCVKCLARDPAQRYPSVFHVRHVLKSWLSRPEMWGLYGASY